MGSPKMSKRGISVKEYERRLNRELERHLAQEAAWEEKEWQERKRIRKRKKPRLKKSGILIILILVLIIVFVIINAVRVYNDLFKGKWTTYSNDARYSKERNDSKENSAGRDMQSESGFDSIPGEKDSSMENGISGDCTDDGSSSSPEGDWNLMLVNKWNPIPRDYKINLYQLKRGHAVDERCYPYLQEMMDDCRDAGLSPLICSSYRSWEKQESLYYNQVRELMAQGYQKEEALEEAKVSNAAPGTSEHHLGLALDIVDEGYQMLDEGQENTPVQKWLMENSYKYGFILRYPNGKSDITGIIYEPWHYRYVGKEAALEIYERGICLEEYLGM